MEELTLSLLKAYAAEDSPWKVPAFSYEIIYNGKAVGTISLRIGTERSLTHLAGQVGYRIDEAHRGQGLAVTAVRQLAPFIRQHGLSPVWFTTTADNAASRRTLEKLGATLVEIVPIPATYPSYAAGEREKLVYRLDSEAL